MWWTQLERYISRAFHRGQILPILFVDSRVWFRRVFEIIRTVPDIDEFGRRSLSFIRSPFTVIRRFMAQIGYRAWRQERIVFQDNENAYGKHKHKREI